MSSLPMSSTLPITFQRGPTKPPDERRTRLQQAQAALAAERQTNRQIQQAINRIHAQYLDTANLVSELEHGLAEAKRNQPHLLAMAFANEEPGTSYAERPVSVAEARLTQAKEQLAHVKEVEQALNEEHTQSNANLDHLQIALHQALAQVVLADDKFLSLFNDLDNAWFTLRTLRTTIHAVMGAVNGNLPRWVYSKHQAVEPLDSDLGYDWDKEFVGTWTTALTNLTNDAKAQLPLAAVNRIPANAG